MRLFDNEIIVIGGNHHNMLGVVRSLGIKGYKSIAIITCSNNDAYISKSKFIKKSFIVRENKETILKILSNLYENYCQKPIIIPTSDFAEYLIDENLDELSKHYILPSINNQQGKIIDYMDKYTQYKLAKDYGIKMAECFKIKLNDLKFLNNYKFKKCILKPTVSANGKKADIRICENKSDLKKYFYELSQLGYDEILIQEYVEFDMECGLIGCINGNDLVLPGIIKKERIYPLKRGSNSFSHIKKTPTNIQIEKIKKFLHSLNYSGMFDIEIFIKGKDIYLNEINFRNSGNTFAYCFDDIFIIYLWILMKLDIDVSNEKKEISKNFDYIDELLERKQLFDKNISFIEYIKTRKKTRARLFSFKGDYRVNIYRYLYAIRRKIKL